MFKSSNRNLSFWLIILVIFLCLTYALRSILLPFVLGCLIGYLFDPLVDKLEKLKINRTIASCIVLLSITLITIAAIVAFAYFTEQQIAVFIKGIPHYLSLLQSKFSPLLNILQENFPDLDEEAVVEYLQNNSANTLTLVGKALQKIINESYALLNIISLLLITPVVAFYMLLDWPAFIRSTDELLPKKYKKDIREQAKAADKIISSFIRGQISVCLILGTYYAVGLSIVGLDLGLLVGLIAGIISFIPYVGSITGFILSMGIAFAQFDTITPILEVAFVFLSGQFIEGNFLTPKLVGDSVDLHPVWIMLALLAGGVLLGFLGMIIAVPMAAVIGVLLRFAIAKYKQSPLYKS